jgi:hypothetical protein
MSTLPTEPTFNLVTFNFHGESLPAGYYAVAVVVNDTSNMPTSNIAIAIGINSAGTAPGNAFQYQGAWIVYPAYDVCFYVYGNLSGYTLNINTPMKQSFPVTVDGTAVTVPATVTLAAGSHTIVTPSTLNVGNPAEPIQFLKWEDGTTLPTRTISLAANMTITATYGLQVTVNPGTGYKFTGWTLDGASAGTVNPITVPLDTNHTLAPAFAVSAPLQATPGGYKLNLVDTSGHTTRQSTGTVEKDYQFYPLVNLTPDIPGTYTVNWMFQNFVDGVAKGSSAHTSGASPAVGDILNTFPNVSAAQQLQLLDNRDPASTGRDTSANGSEDFGDAAMVALGFQDGKWHTFKTEYTAQIVSPSGATVTISDSIQDNFMYPAPPITLTVAASAGGSVSPSGAQSLTVGTAYTFTATPNPNYRFDHWDLAGTSVGSAASLTFTAASTMNGETLTAVFVQATITLTVSAGANGGVTPAGAQTLNIGQTYTFTAVPASGYMVDHWELQGQNIGSTPTMTVTATAAMDTETLVVFFTAVPPAQVTMNVAVSPSGAGTVNPGAGAHQFNVGALVTFTATAQGNYIFDHWTLDSLSYASNPLGLGIVQGMNGLTLTAVFILPTVTITVAAGANGTVNPSGPQTLVLGNTYQYNAIPNTGYYLDHWDLSGASLGSSDPITVSAASSLNGKTLTAIFSAVPPATVTMNIAVSSSNAGVTNPAVGSHVFNVGDTVQITAEAYGGYVFDHWTLDGQVFTANPLSLPIVNSLNGLTLTAVFVATGGMPVVDLPTVGAVVLIVSSLASAGAAVLHVAGVI